MEKEEVVEVEEKNQNGFKAYPSIENHYRDKFIQGVRDNGLDKPQNIWVASEKIHGSNFSVHCFGKFAKYGRRTDFITKDIPIPCQKPGQYFLESFYDARTLVEKFHNNLGFIFENIKSVYPKLTRYVVYGQYFGGNWPENHPQFLKAGAKQVQKGIYYTPHHEFMAFDIFIVTEDSAFWADALDIPKLLKDHIVSIPIYAKGTFDEMMAIDIKIDSTIPQLLGFEKLPKNLIQGMVIRPNVSSKIFQQERAIIKKKNAEFSEIAEKKVEKKEKVEKPLDPQIAASVQQLTIYVNNNRVDSVVSKFPDLKDRNKIKMEIYKDIITDAKKDGYKEAQPEIQKKIEVEVSKVIMKELNEYYKKK